MMNDTTENHMHELATHQQDLHRVFEWLVKIYEQGSALLGAAESLMLDHHQMESLGLSSCYSMARNRTWYFKWMDVQWFAPVDRAADSRVYAFVAVDYYNTRKVGTSLIAGVLEVDTEQCPNAGSPASWAHWAVNTTSRDEGLSGSVQLFGRRKLAGEVEEFTPLPDVSLPKSLQGTVRVTSGSIPIAWLETRERLAEVVKALCELYPLGDVERLAELCATARRECKSTSG